MLIKVLIQIRLSFPSIFKIKVSSMETPWYLHSARLIWVLYKRSLCGRIKYDTIDEIQSHWCIVVRNNLLHLTSTLQGQNLHKEHHTYHLPEKNFTWSQDWFLQILNCTAPCSANNIGMLSNYSSVEWFCKLLDTLVWIFIDLEMV